MGASCEPEAPPVMTQEGRDPGFVLWWACSTGLHQGQVCEEQAGVWGEARAERLSYKTVVIACWVMAVGLGVTVGKVVVPRI